MKIIVCALAALAVLAAGAEVNAQPTQPAQGPQTTNPPQQVFGTVRLESSDVFSEAVERKITTSGEDAVALGDSLEKYGEVQETQMGTSGNLERKAAARLLSIQNTADPQALLRGITATSPGVPERSRAIVPEKFIAEYVSLLVEQGVTHNAGVGDGGDDPLKREARKLFSGDNQREINRSLNAQLLAAPDPEAKFVEVLDNIKASLSAEKQESLRQQLRTGQANAEAVPWPLCIPRCS